MRKVLFGIFTLLFIATNAIAGGARYVIETSGKGVSEIDGIDIKVKIYNEDTKLTASVSEDVDFKIRNPREGDKCEQRADKTDAAGYVEATCYATQAGSYNVYIKSNDKGDESGDIVMIFETRPTNTPTPSPSPTVEPTESETQEDEEEEPTPTPEEEPTPTPEAEVAGFFSDTGNKIALGIIIAALGILGFILWKTKLIDFQKLFKKRELEPFIPKPPKEENPPVNP